MLAKPMTTNTIVPLADLATRPNYWSPPPKPGLQKSCWSVDLRMVEAYEGAHANYITTWRGYKML